MSDVTSGLPEIGSSTNETVTQANEPLEVNAGEALNFDQLDSVQENKANLPNEEEKAEKKTEKKAKEEEKSEEESVDKSKKAKTENIEKPKKNAKIYNVKVGGNDVSIAADGSLEIEKDGKTIPVTVQDLINSYHGTSEISRRFSEIDRTKKQIEADNAAVNAFVDKLASFYNEDKLLDAIDFLINTSGKDPALARMRLYEQLAPEVEQFSLKTPEEKKAYQLELENEWLKRQQLDRQRQEQSQKELSSVESQVKQIQESHSLDDKQFYQLYRELVDEVGMDEARLTPKDVADYADFKTVTGYIQSKIEAANPEYTDVDSLTEELVDLMMNNSSVELDDVEELITELVNESSEEEEVAKKVTSSKRTKEPKNPLSEPVTFDDLSW